MRTAMGEAKLSGKAHDPDYGKKSRNSGAIAVQDHKGWIDMACRNCRENCQGLVISCPMKIDGTSL